jgi:ribosomal-protein-alanine N-acetyltransferase
VNLAIYIRFLVRRDMPSVLAIEWDGFEFAWGKTEFVQCLRRRNCLGMVAVHEERVVGYMIYEFHKTRIHVLNFAVASELWRRGVGRQMADKVKAKLGGARTRITLELAESNLRGQLFWRSQGFRAEGVLPEFYEQYQTDAYAMSYRLRAEPIGSSVYCGSAS